MINNEYVILAKWQDGSITADGWYAKLLADEVAKSMVYGDCVGTIVCRVVGKNGNFDFITSVDWVKHGSKSSV